MIACSSIYLFPNDAMSLRIGNLNTFVHLCLRERSLTLTHLQEEASSSPQTNEETFVIETDIKYSSHQRIIDFDEFNYPYPILFGTWVYFQEDILIGKTSPQNPTSNVYLCFLGKDRLIILHHETLAFKWDIINESNEIGAMEKFIDDLSPIVPIMTSMDTLHKINDESINQSQIVYRNQGSFINVNRNIMSEYPFSELIKHAVALKEGLLIKTEKNQLKYLNHPMSLFSTVDIKACYLKGIHLYWASMDVRFPLIFASYIDNEAKKMIGFRYSYTKDYYSMGRESTLLKLEFIFELPVMLKDSQMLKFFEASNSNDKLGLYILASLDIYYLEVFFNDGLVRDFKIFKIYQTKGDSNSTLFTSIFKDSKCLALITACRSSDFEILMFLESFVFAHFHFGIGSSPISSVIPFYQWGMNEYVHIENRILINHSKMIILNFNLFDGKLIHHSWNILKLTLPTFIYIRLAAFYFNLKASKFNLKRINWDLFLFLLLSSFGVSMNVQNVEQLGEKTLIGIEIMRLYHSNYDKLNIPLELVKSIFMAFHLLFQEYLLDYHCEPYYENLLVLLMVTINLLDKDLSEFRKFYTRSSKYITDDTQVFIKELSTILEYKPFEPILNPENLSPIKLFKFCKEPPNIFRFCESKLLSTIPIMPSDLRFKILGNIYGKFYNQKEPEIYFITFKKLIMLSYLYSFISSIEAPIYLLVFIDAMKDLCSIHVQDEKSYENTNCSSIDSLESIPIELALPLLQVWKIASDMAVELLSSLLHNYSSKEAWSILKFLNRPDLLHDKKELKKVPFSLLIKHLFPNDNRIAEIENLFDSSVAPIVNYDLGSEGDVWEQNYTLEANSYRVLSMACGRCIFYFDTYCTLAAESCPGRTSVQSRIPKINFSVKFSSHTSSSSTLAIEPLLSQLNDFWSSFSVILEFYHVLKLLTKSDVAWIFGHRPSSAPLPYSYESPQLLPKIEPLLNEYQWAGFMYGLGLIGALKSIPSSLLYDLLSSSQYNTSISLLYALACSNIGSMDPLLTKIYCLHIPTLLIESASPSHQLDVLIQSKTNESKIQSYLLSLIHKEFVDSDDKKNMDEHENNEAKLPDTYRNISLPNSQLILTSLLSLGILYNCSKHFRMTQILKNELDAFWVRYTGVRDCEVIVEMKTTGLKWSCLDKKVSENVAHLHRSSYSSATITSHAGMHYSTDEDNKTETRKKLLNDAVKLACMNGVGFETHSFITCISLGLIHLGKGEGFTLRGSTTHCPVFNSSTSSSGSGGSNSNTTGPQSKEWTYIASINQDFIKTLVSSIDIFHKNILGLPTDRSPFIVLTTLPSLLSIILIYMNSNDESMNQLFNISTSSLFEHPYKLRTCPSDVLFYLVCGKYLIQKFYGVMTMEWILHMIPLHVRKLLEHVGFFTSALDDNTDPLEAPFSFREDRCLNTFYMDTGINENTDLIQGLYIIAALGFYMGLRFAGSQDRNAYQALARLLKNSLDILSIPFVFNNLSIRGRMKVSALYSLVDIFILSLSLIMSGSAHLPLLRIIRRLVKVVLHPHPLSVVPETDVDYEDFEVFIPLRNRPYNSFTMLYKSLGFLTLSKGTKSLSTSDSLSLAGVLLSCLPFISPPPMQESIFLSHMENLPAYINTFYQISTAPNTSSHEQEPYNEPISVWELLKGLWIWGSTHHRSLIIASEISNTFTENVNKLIPVHLLFNDAYSLQSPCFFPAIENFDLLNIDYGPVARSSSYHKGKLILKQDLRLLDKGANYYQLKLLKRTNAVYFPSIYKNFTGHMDDIFIPFELFKHPFNRVTVNLFHVLDSFLFSNYDAETFISKLGKFLCLPLEKNIYTTFIESAISLDLFLFLKETFGLTENETRVLFVGCVSLVQNSILNDRLEFLYYELILLFLLKLPRLPFNPSLDLDHRNSFIRSLVQALHHFNLDHGTLFLGFYRWYSKLAFSLNDKKNHSIVNVDLVLMLNEKFSCL